MKNNSPWIADLHRTRDLQTLRSSPDSDVLIVGGGIAGIITAYFLLTRTNKKIILLEGGKVAHGATGHNAGQLTSYFERPFSDLVREFGLESAAFAQCAVESSWGLLEEVVSYAQITTPWHTFTGFAGLVNREQIVIHVTNNLLREQGGLPREVIYIADDAGVWETLSDNERAICTRVSRSLIGEMLNSHNEAYIGCLAYKKGCMNSARFTEELASFLIRSFKDRFALFEDTYMKELILEDGRAIALTQGEHVVRADQVILCTNGFEKFSITNRDGASIDTAFHHMIQGCVGYMSGYVEQGDRPPVAISYFLPSGSDPHNPTGDVYYYVTRRPHEIDGDRGHTLISIGGPEHVLSDDESYELDESCPTSVTREIHSFLASNYRTYPFEEERFTFCWHGLMGYTPNRIRRIGFEPCNTTLLYNLGCNGVGILPAIYGGYRISQLLNNEIVTPSIFDPMDSRCALPR